MGLREIAESDLAKTLEDDVFGFGWPITITAPDGDSANLIGLTADIAQVIDPDTGQAVSGRLASITIRLSTIYSAGFVIPIGISDTDIKPWIVTFDDINGLPYTFKIVQSNPDRTLGVVALLLETYIP